MVNPRREPSDIVQLKVRMREQLRAQLEREADQARTSLNATIVDRLDRSFRDQRAHEDGLEVAYGAQGAALLSILGRAMRYQIAKGGTPIEGEWLDNPAVYSRVERAIAATLDVLRPIGDVPVVQGPNTPENDTHRILLAIGDESRGHAWSRWAERLRSLLGTAAGRIVRWRQHHLNQLEEH